MKENYRKALRLEYFTLGYTIIEATVSIIAGVMAGSVALFSFGLDSIAESLSGIVLIWRLKKQDSITSAEEEFKVEQRAEKLVGLSFLLLAGYILYETIDMILSREIPDPSLPGIIIAVAALIIMPILAYKKYKWGEKLSLRSLKADAKETLVCSSLSLALLIGLIANYFFGFWQLDPLVSLLIVVFLVREGWELLYT